VVGASYFYFVKTTAFKIVCEILILAAILAAGGVVLSWTKRNLARFLPEKGWPGFAGGTAAAAFALAFAFVAAKDGLKIRRPDLAKDLETYAQAAGDWSFPQECIGADPAGDLRPCRLGRADDSGVLFIGDSFAMHIYGRFAEEAKFNSDSSFTFVASPGCPPVTRMQMAQNGHSCHGFFQKALQFAKAHRFKRIVLSSRWHAYFRPNKGWMCFETESGCRVEKNPAIYYPLFDAALSDLRGRLLDLKERGAEIVILWATPGGEWNVPAELVKRKFLRLDAKEVEYVDQVSFERSAAETKRRLMELAAAIGGKFIDPFEFLCDGRRCPTVDKDGAPYYIDDQHIRATFIKTARFQFLDDAAGISNRVSAVPGGAAGRPKY
jgi:SGNH domain (fused to AT3 domains)